MRGLAAVVGFLVCVELASGVLQGYYTPMLTDIARHLGVHDADVNWLEGTPLMLSALVVPAFAKLGDSIYFRDPNGQQLEIAVYKFEPPAGYTHGEVLAAAHNLRIADGAYAIEDRHLADALAQLVARRAPRIETPAASEALSGAHDPRAAK